MNFWRSFVIITASLALLFGLSVYYQVFRIDNSLVFVALTATSLMSAIAFKILQGKVSVSGSYVIMKGILGSLGVKSLITIFIVVFIKIKFPEEIVPFVGYYFFSYFIYTTLAVYHLLRNLRPQIEGSKPSSNS
ncbi:MAG: hypothetical protein LC115_13825 [Bacteroidia bacterium]|nr:hypothetical protein [Bacteroidia bacterium]